MAPNTVISAPPWAVLGYRQDGRPIYAVAGGSVDASPEPDPVASGEADEATDGASEDADDGWVPPSRDEYESLLAAKKKADGEAAARRKYLRQHGIDPKTGEKVQPDESELPGTPDRQEADQPQGISAAELHRQVEKASAAAELRGMRKTRALVTGVNSALAEAGWNGTRLNAVMKLLDLDEVDVDDDGEISGLSEQIADIKTDFPELFKRMRAPAAAANGAGGSGQNGAVAAKVDAADKRPPQPEPTGWAQQLAQRALRG
ncbi:phage scaffolding protein [Streptomyces cinnamoneus]|uniref:phage scaffolding protein n=1 Tax=Streptomyces cinnamoneus TaxID=53446 RepID=UPI0034032827